MFLVQKWPFFNFFFLGNIGQKNVLYNIRKQKKAFLGFKRKKFKKSQKIDIIPRGLTHGFGIKMAIFRTIIFRQSSVRKCLLKYSRTNKRLSRI